MRLTAYLVCLLLSTAASAAAQGPLIPHGGDVDRDRRLTTHDAVQISQSLSWPERGRLHAFLAACDVNHDGQCDLHDADAILRVVIKDQNDFDGDGVPNAADCAPFDDRLATPHTYYVDADRDQYGDAGKPAQICSVTPEPPFMPRAGDPSDVTPYALAPPVPKGHRVLAVDFGAGSGDAQWRPDLARELGAEATALRVGWSEIETSPGQYAGGTALRAARDEYAAQGLAVSLTVAPIAGALLVLPEDLRVAVESGAMRLSDPPIVSRFAGVLSFMRDQLAGVPLTSLQIGYDVDLFLAQRPDHFWSDFGGFLYAVAGHARILWPGVRVGFTATLPALIQAPTRDKLLAINGISDVVSFSWFPRHSGFLAADPTTVRAQIEQAIALYHPKPLYAQSIGYPTAPLTGSSETKQSQFILAIFETWDAWAEQMPFVCFSRLHDLTPERAAFESQLWGGGPLAAAYWRTTGLRVVDASGRPKTGYNTLRMQALNRGWLRYAPKSTRVFHLGFTPSPYDGPPDPVEYARVVQWMDARLATDTDIINLHLDSGVPWVEALADDFSSPELPYSPAQKERWSDLRRHIPAGHKVLVSLNPLGIPRSILAPYFGVGNGFSFSEDFQRIPDGIVKDADNRMPPPPWDGYELNHPDVKTAFVNYCRRAIEFFQPDYLIVAVEITATMNESYQAYDKFLDLQRYVYARLKADPATSQVPILVSISATSFVRDEYGIPLKFEEQPGRKHDLQVQGLLDVLPHVDMVALSLYPHYGKYNATQMVASMYDELLGLLEAAGKPVGVSESGWPSETFDLLGFPFLSTPEKQDAFLAHLFYSLEKSTLPIEFIMGFSIRDNDYLWHRLLQGSQQQPPTVSPTFVEFYKYFRDIGIYDGDGNPRLSWQRWQDMLARPHAPRP